MGAANHKRIEVAAAPQCAMFRPRTNPKIDVKALAAFAGILQTPLTQILIFILTSSLLAFATSLSMHLLNLRMHDTGATEFGIGVSVAMQALGIILVAPLAKHAIAAFGIRRTFGLGALIASCSLVAFAWTRDIYVCAMLRMVMAGGLALLFTVSESLVISRTDSSNRGRLIGWYATGLAVGTAAGPAFVAIIGVEGLLPLLWSAFFFWLTIAPVIACVGKAEELAPVVRKSTFQAIYFLPVAFLTAFVFGILDNGGLSMLSVYTTINGYDYSQAALFVATATTGGILLQIPLGFAASDRDPRLLLLLCGVCSIALLTLLPNIMGVHAIALGVSFLLGGLLEGFYTIGLICVAKHCRTIGVSSANGCFVSMCGFGEFVGPLTTGTGIQYLGSNGFVVGLTTVLAFYIVGVVFLKSGASSESVKV